MSFEQWLNETPVQGTEPSVKQAMTHVRDAIKWLRAHGYRWDGKSTYSLRSVLKEAGPEGSYYLQSLTTAEIAYYPYTR